MISTRNELPGLINKLGLIRGVEIGVWKGEFSEFLLKNCPDLHLTLIDCWQQQPDEIYFDIMNQPEIIQEQCYQETVNRMNKYPGRYEIIRGFSDIEGIDLESRGWVFDFIYMDGNHSYEATKRDLEIWYEMLVVGGLMSGHDYLDADNACGSRFGVKSAVDEFIQKKNISDFFVTDEQWPTWGFIKCE